jgi:hypothetical protein
MEELSVIVLQRVSTSFNQVVEPVGCQNGAVVRSMFEINISACHLLRS